MIDVDALARTLGLGALLDALRRSHGGYELLDHWAQGEFHHDTVVRTAGVVLVVATNCNGGVKEVLAFDAVPERWALWHLRCPDNDELAARLGSSWLRQRDPRRITRQASPGRNTRVTVPLAPVRARAQTSHWFDPCELLAKDARSELKPSCRKRAPGGGWQPA